MTKTIQIRDVPDVVYAELKRRAAQQGLSLSGYLRSEVVKLMEQSSPSATLSLEELLERVRQRPRVELQTPIEDIIRANRDGDERV